MHKQFKQNIYKHLMVLTFTMAASSVILMFLHLINGRPTDNRKKSGEQTAVFYIENHVAPPPKANKTKTKPVRQNTASIARPNLSGQVGGFNFEGGAADFSDLNSMTNELIGGQDSIVMTADSVDQVPKAVFTTDVNFPSEAKKRGVSGYVIFNLLIDPDGRVENARVLESSPPDIFEEAALASVKQWRFEAALYKGKKVAVWAKQRIKFQLN